MAWSYTTIRHQQRIQLGLSNDEYCFLDLIYRRSVHPQAPVKGWCIASASTIAKELGFCRKTINRMTKRLVNLGYMEKSENGKMRKTKAAFFSIAYADEQGQSVPSSRDTKSLNGGNNRDTESPQTGTQSPTFGDKESHSNIISNIEEVINNIGEHGSPNDKPVFFAKVVLNFLAQKTGKRFIVPDDVLQFRASNKFSHINARFRDGATLKDFRDVIEAKTSQWLEDPKMNQYLRPSTLFCKKNFERYLDDAQNFDTRPNEQQAQMNTQQRAKEQLTKLYKAHKAIWKQKYTNQAKTDYIKALELFYLDNPKLRPDGSTTP